MRFAKYLLATALLCTVVPVQRPRADIIDQNGNGLDDVWESIYHVSDPNGDDDGDGFTNLQEAIAGTDPKNSNSHPPVATIAVTGGSVTLTWNTVRGKQYRVQTATTTGANAAWTYLGSPYYSTGTTLSATFGVTPGGTHYYRIEVGDVDSDGDGVNDWDEIQLGFDPFRTDTYNTGFGDRQTILTALASANTVGVAAAHPVASAAFGDGGVLNFTRGGNLNIVTIDYTVSGTAVPGTDYAALSGTVSIPRGVNSVSVNVNPLANATFTSSRTVKVTLSTSTAYKIDPNAPTATVTFYPKLAATGQVAADYWDGITNIYDLADVPFDASPATRRGILRTLELPTGTGKNEYATRIRGYMTAPTTGTYTFWCAADDLGQFSLSTDDQMANLVVRAYTDSWTDSEEWNKYATQKSAAIALVAGKRYAFECQMLQFYGGDNFAVGWLKPGETGTVPSQVVPGSVLSGYNPPYSPPGLTTLYFGALEPVANAPASAQGFASLRLSSDGTVGILSVSSSGLSGAPTSIALRGPSNPTQVGPVIAEFVNATPQTDGSYIWQVPAGTDVSTLKSGKIYVGIATSAHGAGEVRGQLLRSEATGAFTPPAAPPALPTAAPNGAQAARLMTQATFGPNGGGIGAIVRDGYAAWVDDQLNAPVTLTLPFVNAAAASGQSINDDTFQESWWRNAITAPDQLRQRVAFALSEIMVISDVDGNLDNPGTLAAYYDVLLKDAFGNYRTLLEDVTLSPVMGDYLNMLQNDKADPSTGQVPNENYGREAMQLFTVGLKKLNPDGTLLLDSNALPIPTYGQTEVEGFSRVYTGWNFAQVGAPGWEYVSPNWRQPMGLVPGHHDLEPKQLLDNVVLPAGQSGQQDLKDGLDLLFNHPNVGPFFCRELIQRLVTSNPSPGYVYRVAQVFANNGQNVRGDLHAVVRAILLDYEARSDDARRLSTYGKEREPLVRLANVYRAFNARSYGGHYAISEYATAPNYGQAPLDSPSVFNFFSPNYTLTGEIAEAGLVCPEFQITTATTVVFSSNDVRNRVTDVISASYPTDIGLDLSAYAAVAGNPATLIDKLNPILLNGQMSPGLRTQLTNAINSVDASNPLGRAQTAVQIICTAPEFCIQK